MRTGERVFMAPHDQLCALRNRAVNSQRSIYYAFPLIGTTAELQADPDLLSQTWLVDVSKLVQVGCPTKSNGQPRRNNCHNVYVTPGHAIFRTKPVPVSANNFQAFVKEGFPGSDGINRSFDINFQSFWEFSQQLSRGARGLVLW